MDRKVEERLKAKQSDDPTIHFFRKQEDLQKFEEYIKELSHSNDKQNPGLLQYYEADRMKYYRESIDVAVKMLDDLNLNHSERLAILGFHDHGGVKWRPFLGK